MEPLFERNAVVQRVNQPESVGVILGSFWDDQTETWTYRVQFGNTINALPESSLRTLDQASDPWEKMQKRSFSGVEHFRNLITFHKLISPTARVAYAYSTARTLFFPHQFKPLLKFLNNSGKGILIADDVGLGKTIEAGYILRELQARQELERVIVLVPARLGIKWKREMQLRFEEDFEIVKGSDLIDFSRKIETGKEVMPFKWIVSYEGARSERVREAIENAQPNIDFLIVDEAHRLRNTETSQYKLGRILCDLADTSIFLTATPVQNRLEDLWNLLRLLSPDEFPDWEIFLQQVRANRLILECQQSLSKRPADVKKVKEILGNTNIVKGLGAPVSEIFLQSILNRLDDNNHSTEDLAELSSDVSQLNILGHMISRTRKSEAMPNCARREAMWTKVKFSHPEQSIYESVENLCRTNPNENSASSWGFRMATMMAYRATASCIPAAIEYFSEKLASKEKEYKRNLDYYFESGELASEIEFVSEDSEKDVSNWFEKKRDFLSELIDYWQINGGIDTKLTMLTDAIEKIWKEDNERGLPNRKIVIFSFFRKTLEYLRKSLSEDGIKLQLIYGPVKLKDREKAIEDFLSNDEVNILLTSEVGGEGIDLQKASVLFNYDLPWNPMVVEQRIGRLDRIGQTAEKILIVNLVVNESIEERILQRLLNKIGIFESTIGEIDPIIGDQIEDLTRKALSGVLSPEQLEDELKKEERAIANRTVEAKQVRTQANNLFTSDQSLLDEISALTGERQIPKDADLLVFVNKFLADRYPSYQITNDSLNRVVSVNFSPKLGLDMEKAFKLGNDVSSFGRKISSGSVSLTISREVGYRHTNANLIHIKHPLIRFILSELEGKFGNETFCLAVPSSSVLEPGFYAFAINMIEIRGDQTRNKLAIAVTDITKDRIWLEKSETNTILSEMLDQGKSIADNLFPSMDFKNLENRLLKGLSKLRKEIDDREHSFAQARTEQRKAISIRLAQMKLEKTKLRLHNLMNSDAKPFAVKMGESKVLKAQEGLDLILKSYEETAPVGVESWTDIAVGLLKVGDNL